MKWRNSKERELLTWENRRRLDYLDMMHGISCSSYMGEEDFYDEEDEDIEDGDEEEISVT